MRRGLKADRWGLSGLILALAYALAQGAAADEPVDYARQIKPLLAHRCFSCHGALKHESGLRLDSAALIAKGGEGGAVIEPGSAAKSPLIERVSSPDESFRMPSEGKPLTAAQIALLREWIDQGAKTPSDDAPEPDPREHWAFRSPARPPLPTVANSAWVQSPIDAFVAAEHERRGLAASVPAEKHVWLRRVTIDLIGLPPTREELHAFLADESPQAYERVVDRLLASPHYGERWGRHWMDVWRYSDWYGRRAVPDVMNSYAQIWRWRDWIVGSLNADKGYDRMVLEMLAADEIAPDDLANLPATGFLVRNWFKWNYHSWMKDNVEHTGKAFLALTFNCCQCHDHKYDPLSQEEYFKFRAFFEPLELRHERVPGEADPGPFKKYVYAESYGPIKSGMIRVFDEKLDAQTFMYAGGDARNKIEGKPPVPPGVPALLGGKTFRVEPISLPATASYPGLRTFVQEEEIAKRQADVTMAEDASVKALATKGQAEQHSELADKLEDAILAAAVAQAHVSQARAQLAATKARVAADDAKYRLAADNAGELAKQASSAERQAAVLARQADLARAEQALALAKRKPPSDEKAKAELAKAEQQVVAAGKGVETARASLAIPSDQYTALSATYPAQSTGRRAALARWITSRENPLAARVAVNHLWARHFEMPLVETTYNFGRNGKAPSHPELLDWLAVELMDSGWSMKHLHRLIVTSSAYRMKSSAAEPMLAQNKALDPDNRFLWRYPLRRIEAEAVRDSILFTAGELDLALGGPDIDYQKGLLSRRRSLYFTHHGEEKMEFLDLFDGANPADCYRRTATVIPQQALALSNSEFSATQSRLLARRLWVEVTTHDGSDDAKRQAYITAVFETLVSRQPSTDESNAAARFLQRQTRLFQTQGLQPLEAEYRARENLAHALFSHNDFVTIR